jgi:thiamine-monophosphate kinase
MSGIDQCCEFCGTGIIGGDTKSGPGIVTGTAIGTMDGRRPLTRSGAEPGDLLAVTGPLGGPAAALLDIEHDLGLDYTRESLYVPIPRIDAGVDLASSGCVTSCMDLSDGLGTAINTICQSSGVGMMVEYDFLPKAAGVQEASDATGTPMEDLLMYCGGEYELMFTVKKDGLDKLYEMELEFSVIGLVNDSGKAELIREGKRSEIGYGRY